MADDPQDVADRERIFKRFDANGDGKVSSSELGDVLKTLGSVTTEEVQRMMAEIDTDGDGFISFEEFVDFAKANRGLVKDTQKFFQSPNNRATITNDFVAEAAAATRRSTPSPPPATSAFCLSIDVVHHSFTVSLPTEIDI
ncbi:polcalcin Ole e 3-like [Henckelia pumila]|uniref:polcalcin Ole e 3-like n=1 Tax=Henckelia pumila TaxID=405737 RepID=UPI003C6E867B